MDDQLYQRLLPHSEAVPSPASVGMFSYDGGSGVGGFLWFDDLDALDRFLRTDFADYAGDPTIRVALVVVLDRHPLVPADPNGTVRVLNRVLGRLHEIVWIGTFAEMCEGDDEFPRRVRDRLMGDVSPVEATRVSEFQEGLGEYGL